MQQNLELAIAQNRLGVSYFRQQKYQESIEAYQCALDLKPDFIDAYYNLGLAFKKLNQIESAKNAYLALIELSPAYIPVHFQLGCLYMQEENHARAMEYFLKVNAAWPEHGETKTNLGTCYLKSGELKLARQYYLEASALLPTDTQVLFNLGVIDVQLELLSEAVHFYQRVVDIDPAHLEAHQNLGFIFLVMKNKSSALIHFKEVLRLQPNNLAVSHTINILNQEKAVTSSPPEYIQSLFDSYADHYDRHLKSALNFQVPHILYDAYMNNNKNNNKLNILDIGCGTGLSGELFKPLASKLTGVDLSFNMLALAKQKNIYDELQQQDVLVFLENKIACYDLIIASDVFVYIGDLSIVFAKIKQALMSNGYLIFNAEINNQADYALTESGRFNHSKNYLDLLAANYGFMIVSYNVKPLRMQDHQPVMGHVYVLRVL